MSSNVKTAAELFQIETQWCLETESDSDRVDLLDSAQAINNMLVKMDGWVKLWTSTNHYHKLHGSLATMLHIISFI